jgi:hypothetical protein
MIKGKVGEQVNAPLKPKIDNMCSLSSDKTSQHGTVKLAKILIVNSKRRIRRKYNGES